MTKKIRKEIMMENENNASIFVLPMPIGSEVYRKDGCWIVYGYDCDNVGTWRFKLKRFENNYIKATEYSKPLVSSFGKSVFASFADMEKYFIRKEKKRR